MSVRIRRIDDHSDEGYIRVVLKTDMYDKLEITVTGDEDGWSSEDLGIAIFDDHGSWDVERVRQFQSLGKVLAALSDYVEASKS